MLHKTLWQWVQTTNALDRLSHEESNLAWGVEVNGFFHLICISLGRVLSREWASEKIREASGLYALSPWWAVIPRAYVCEMLSAAMAMITIFESQNWEISSVLSCKEGCHSVGLRATGCKVYAVYSIWELVHQLLSIQAMLVIHID